MNILIKLSCLVGLAIAPILGERAANADHIGMQQPQQKVIQMSNVPTQPAAAPIGK